MPGAAARADRAGEGAAAEAAADQAEPRGEGAAAAGEAGGVGEEASARGGGGVMAAGLTLAIEISNPSAPEAGDRERGLGAGVAVAAASGEVLGSELLRE